MIGGLKDVHVRKGKFLISSDFIVLEMEEDSQIVIILGRPFFAMISTIIMNSLDVGVTYPISNSPWVSLVDTVPKKGGMTIMKNEKNELIPTRTRLVRHSTFATYMGILDFTKSLHT
ncbi:hypothetical protein CR513_15154, partial [Mucuna pruriens]